MTAPEMEAAYLAVQRALTAIEAQASGKTINLDGCATCVDELARFALAAIRIAACLAASFDRPPGEVIDWLRMWSLTAVTS